MLRRMPADDDPMRIFDRRLVRLRRERAAATVGARGPGAGGGGGTAARPAGRHHAPLLPRARPRRPGRGGAALARARHRLRRFDGPFGADGGAVRAGLAVAGDEEWLPFAPESFDLVVANLSLHWVNDLPGALVQIRRCLRPDGLFLASLPGLGTLGPLREALAAAEAELRGGVSPRVSPFPELQDLAGLLQRAGFALPVADAEELPLAYRTPPGAAADLRAAGETECGAGARRRGCRRGRCCRWRLARLPAEAEGIRPVLRLLVMTGWAPHESQQQAGAAGQRHGAAGGCAGGRKSGARGRRPGDGDRRRALRHPVPMVRQLARLAPGGAGAHLATAPRPPPGPAKTMEQQGGDPRRITIYTARGFRGHAPGRPARGRNARHDRAARPPRRHHGRAGPAVPRLHRGARRGAGDRWATAATPSRPAPRSTTSSATASPASACWSRATSSTSTSPSSWTAGTATPARMYVAGTASTRGAAAARRDL